MTFEPPNYMQNSDLFEYGARQDRFLIDLFFREGLLDAANTGQVTGAAAGSNLAVEVAPFEAVIKGDDEELQGSYLLRLVEAEVVTTDPPPQTGSRLDLLVCELLDSEHIALAGRPEGPRLRAIPGTVVTSGTPVLPATPPTAITLASWPVAAGQSAITTASITNRRVQSAAHPDFDVNLQVVLDAAAEQTIQDAVEEVLAAGRAATSGTLAARPLPADAGANTLFVATDGANAGRAFLSTGSAWVELAVNLYSPVVRGYLNASGGVLLPSSGSVATDAPVGTLARDANSKPVIKTVAASATYAAVGGAQKAQGSYVGNNSQGKAVAVGFAPDLVLIVSNSATGTGAAMAWLTEPDTYPQTVVFTSSSSVSRTSGDYLTPTGFTLTSSAPSNVSGTTYRWTAFKFS